MGGGHDGSGGMPNEEEMNERPQLQNSPSMPRKTINDGFILSKEGK